jgi:hypothetical protein
MPEKIVSICKACKADEKMLNLGPTAKDKVASLKHRIPLLLDMVNKNNNKLNKNESYNLTDALELYKCTKTLSEKETTLTKLTGLLSLQQEQCIAHQADAIDFYEC